MRATGIDSVPAHVWWGIDLHAYPRGRMPVEGHVCMDDRPAWPTCLRIVARTLADATALLFQSWSGEAPAAAAMVDRPSTRL